MRDYGFSFQPFSRKQQALLNCWRDGSPYAQARLIVADGAIRSGKTVAMICSFLQWSASNFSGGQFILAGRSVGSLKRNVIGPMLQILRAWRWPCEYNRGEGRITIGTNVFYTFGASNELAQDALQGMTASGALADEVALFPRSFVDQMIARCSVKGSRIFMNCNPQGAYHYFKTDYIDRADEIGMYYLHFTMDDNLTLSAEIRDSYYRSFTGVFFKQYILGLWVSAEGAVYPMWDDDANTYDDTANTYDDTANTYDDAANTYDDAANTYDDAGAAAAHVDYQGMTRYIAIDYGTHNPMVFLDAYDDGKTFRIRREYYWDSSVTQRQKTDSEYADDLLAFTDGSRELTIIIDPSAASFIAECRNRGFRVRAADNNVRDGISVMSTMIGQRRLLVEKHCKNFMAEIHSYVWDEKAKDRGVEQPVKEHDHAMDACRYLLKTLVKRYRLMR